MKKVVNTILLMGFMYCGIASAVNVCTGCTCTPGSPLGGGTQTCVCEKCVDGGK